MQVLPKNNPFETLESMHNNKSPGHDDLSKGFYEIYQYYYTTCSN